MAYQWHCGLQRSGQDEECTILDGVGVRSRSSLFIPSLWPPSYVHPVIKDSIAPLILERKENLCRQRKLTCMNYRKGGTLAQKSRQSPPPQGMRTEGHRDLEGCWKHRA
eukprot:scaffold175371_cov16-Tisochrysis_lutea.AAC.2